MTRLLAGICALALSVPRAQAPPDTSFYAVAYVETAASSARDAAAALRAYREAIAKQEGCSAVDTFEQIGRPGHWVIVETWRDQKAFDARDPAVQQRLLEAIKDSRVSGFDQRPVQDGGGGAGTRGRRGERGVRDLTRGRRAQPGGGADAVAPGGRQPPGARQPALRRAAAHDARQPFHGDRDVARPGRARRPRGRAPHQEYRDDILPLTGSPLDERVFTGAR